MAKDIQSGNAETLRSVHQLIDFGWEETLSAGLAQEKSSNRIANADLSAQTLERNRLDVLARGRAAGGGVAGHSGTLTEALRAIRRNF